MKARIYISTLLALTIQVMVNGQTPGNQVSKNDNFGLGLNYSDEASPKKQLMDGKEVIQDKVVVRTSPSTKTSAENLQQQAEELSLKSKYLREAAVNNTGLSKTELMEEANVLYKQAELMFITALELSGTKNKEAYTLNKTTINQLLETSNLSAFTAKQAQSLISDAEMNMRYAYEMREEANAMPTTGAKLGSLSNADEKETLALGAQTQAINILKGFALNMAGIDINTYAVSK
jgi:hypothetical protein